MRRSSSKFTFTEGFIVVLVDLVDSICSWCRVELEDMQMKHNSAIKQLLREFNTKEASKETEIDSAVKEAIGEDPQTAQTAFWDRNGCL